MNQPKFKFGDKVCANQHFPFTVKLIEWCDTVEKYFYKEKDSESWTGECLLELYQEPKTKKLYAYKVAGKLGEMKMFAFELEKGVADVNYLSRTPEYDIEYPLEGK